MTLKDKLEVEIMHLPLTDDVINAIGIELEQRAENFAIGFAEWVCDCEYNIQWFKDQNRTNELLEMYKKSL